MRYLAPGASMRNTLYNTFNSILFTLYILCTMDIHITDCASNLSRPYWRFTLALHH